MSKSSINIILVEDSFKKNSKLLTLLLILFLILKTYVSWEGIVVQQVKPPTEKPASHLGVPRVEPYLAFQSGFLPAHTVGGSRRRPKHLAPCCPFGRQGWNSWLQSTHCLFLSPYIRLSLPSSSLPSHCVSD